MTAKSPAHLRSHRAKAARVLLSLFEADQLDSPEFWTWEMMDLLPGWCLDDAEVRTQLQLLCGAVALAPEVRLWIDRRQILTAQQLLGKDIFDAVVQTADEVSHGIDVPAEHVIEHSFIERHFMKAGASVLSSALDSRLPKQQLIGVLGESYGELNAEFAQNLVDQANRLAQTTCAMAAPSGKSAENTSAQPELDEALA
ncbi:MAG: hypothetical protein KTR35_07580 [Gammaproteobacteria bacterium]|nr:hypothetical protein [Gammaproteobacteria bacterium]